MGVGCSGHCSNAGTATLAHGGLGLATGAGLSCKPMLPTPKSDRTGYAWGFEIPPASALPVLPVLSGAEILLVPPQPRQNSGVVLQVTDSGASVSLLAPSPAVVEALRLPGPHFSTVLSPAG